MKRRAGRAIGLLTTLGVAVTALFFADAAMAAPPRRVAVDLIADHITVTPGQTFTVAIRERIEPGWHTYWVNPGDSGEPTSIEWQLPAGFRASELKWPAPRAIPIGPLTNYGYENEVLLPASMEVPKDAASGPVTFSGKVRLLVCHDICIPEESDVSLTLAVGPSSTPSADKDDIDAVNAKLPQALPEDAAGFFEPDDKGFVLKVTLPASSGGQISDARFFPLAWGYVSNAAPQKVETKANELLFTLQRGELKDKATTLEGLVVLNSGGGDGERKAYLVSAKRLAKADPASGFAPLAGGTAGAGTGANAGAGTGTADFSLYALLGAVAFAFLGGVILNLMPCVFPVLALKALAFAKGSQADHRAQGMAYLAGVLASFVAFAVVIAALRAGSAALGWGFQFQSPTFVLLLALLFFALGLSLSGVFSFGGGILGVGDRLARRPGVAGYFFTGVLATLAATPCTAPFMGAAVGYALTQPIAVMLTVMLALGLGFAAPVVALSLSPRLQVHLPKAGAWMETLKQALAFPLYATAAWLIWVLSLQAPDDGVLAAGVGIVGVGLAAFIAGKTALAPLRLKLVAPAVTLGVVALAIASLPGAQEEGSGQNAASASRLAEEPFSQARLESLNGEGRKVFVNLTAAWCITCKVNERVALSSQELAEAFKAKGIVYLKGDWTRENPDITAFLHKFGRAGVPLYVYYPGQGAAPKVLPQILTPSAVLDEISAGGNVVEARSGKGT